MNLQNKKWVSEIAVINQFFRIPQKIMEHKNISTTLDIYVPGEDDYVEQEMRNKVLLGESNAYQISYRTFGAGKPTVLTVG